MSEIKIKSKKSYALYSFSPNEKFLTKEDYWDENGNILKEIEYNEEGMLISKNIFKYNEANLLINEKNYIENEELSQERIIDRNDAGLIIREKINYMDGSHTIRNFYRPEANYIKIESIDSEEGLESIEKIKTDEKNRVLLREIFDENNELISKEENRFEEDNLISRTLDNDTDGFTIEKFSYTNNLFTKYDILNDKNELIGGYSLIYDNENRVIERKYHSGTRIVYEYDENKEIEKHIAPNGIIEFQSTIEFDNNGNEIKFENINESNIFEYEYY